MDVDFVADNPLPEVPGGQASPASDALGFGPDRLVEAFAAMAGREVEWTLRCGGVERRYRGRIPARRRWSRPDDPVLVLRPGQTDAVHVLSEMHLRLICWNGRWGVGRRRWHEDQDLDYAPLGDDPPLMSLRTAAATGS